MAYGTEYYGESPFGASFPYIFYNLCMSAIVRQHFTALAVQHFITRTIQHFSATPNQHYTAIMVKC